jgi:hypothetical protein
MQYLSVRRNRVRQRRTPLGRLAAEELWNSDRPSGGQADDLAVQHAGPGAHRVGEFLSQHRECL